MRVDLLVNKGGEVIVIYNTPFAEDEFPTYGEYDCAARKLWFYNDRGESRELGLPILSEIESKFHRKDFRINFLCMKDKKIYQILNLPILMDKRKGQA